jgi:hypothetical protein
MSVETLKNTHGGARKGAGAPKGTKWASTIAKEEARELVRKIITEQLAPIVGAHVTNALGIKYLVTRNAKTGKFERVSKERMEQLLESGSEELELVEVYDKDPSVEAFKTLLDRALDKPKEQVQEVSVTVQGLEERIRAAQSRTSGK